MKEAAQAQDADDLMIKESYFKEVFEKNHKLLKCEAELGSEDNYTSSEDQEQLESEEQKFIEQ